jgi:uncharacterized spore protein YtfJ
MLAIGCFIPFVLLGLGAAIGSYLGADRGGYWGAAAGLGAGILIVAIAFWALERTRSRG